MKSKLLLVFVLVSSGFIARTQSMKLEIPNYLPKNVKTDQSTPQTYRVTTDYFDFDLTANFIKKAQVAGTFTCYLENDSVKWNDVTIAESNSFKEPFPDGQKQTALENFTYIQSPDCLKEQFFSSMPTVDFRLKNLIWDMIAFEVFVYPYWDSLSLNIPFEAKLINGEVQMANDGVFENKEIKLTWIGVAKINNELCAIIKYSQMNGKLELNTENLKMKGRSHYWGEVYVSLKNKQIEYALLTEDVVTNVQLEGQEKSFLGYTVRSIKLEKQLSNEEK